MLAIALSALVLYLVSIAIDLHLGSLDKRGAQVEQAQLARAVLQMMASDLRNVVYAPASEGSSGESDGMDGGDGTEDSGGTSGATGSSGTASSTSDTSTDVIDNGFVFKELGLYGTLYEIQVDVSRLPRPDQYIMLLDERRIGALQDRVSEVKTVAYYLQVGALTNTALGGTSDQSSMGGLFRRVLDKATTVWAGQMGNIDGLQQSAELLAAEVVALEFRYFDGLSWYEEWDSETYGGLPAAVEISIALSPANSGQDSDAAPSVFTSTDGTLQGDQVYRLLVRLPTGDVITEEDMYSMEESMP